MYKRTLNIALLLKESSYFLFGPRAVGKTSLINASLPKAVIFDLLNDDTYEELLRRPTLLSEKIPLNQKQVVIDEIQRLPVLLNEVHRLIEKRGLRFLLTGSSAKKLRHGGANMLGGRANESHLYPLTWYELGKDFDLHRYLQYGGLPLVYTSKDPQAYLKAYVRTYLAEEIKAETLIRNYERFVRFLETMALSNAQELNYASIANDAGIPARTLENHIEVLKDTLMAHELLPFTKTVKRKAVTRSKFYFFDTGVANFLSERLPMASNSSDLGSSFEQWIIQEVRAYLAYHQIDKKLTYWRSRDSEVDLIIGREVAIEIKFAKDVHSDHLVGLKKLKEENLIKRYILVGRFKSAGIRDQIEYLPYEEFLADLWEGRIV
jgi:predicted AAA+ superfamily ATPase